MAISCVVVAVDGSSPSLHAVSWAAEEASRRGVRLVVVHACLRERYEGDTPDEEEPASERKVVHELLAAAVERARRRCPDVAVEAEVLPQETVSALLGLDHLSPLLVLGWRGHGGLAGLLLGSVSLQVASRATYPVVVVRGDPDHRRPWHGGVVLGAGPNGTAQELIGFAVEAAALRRTELHLVHAWHPDAVIPGRAVREDAGAPAQHARELLAAVVLPDTPDGVTVRRSCAPGGAASVLLRAGADAHLIVVGAQPRHGRHRGLQLGPVNHAVLHHAPCAVAVVPCPDV
jgi:nucleotide-binding universal stress UspA family protein